MHRSGTSALARTLGLLGHTMPDSLVPANAFNAPGFWEPEALVAANDRILRLHQRHWADPKPLVTRVGSARAAQAVATDCWSRNFGAASSLVLKDPRVSRTFAYWRAQAADPHVLLAVRHPLEVARSIRRSGMIRRDHGLRLWQTYTLEAELASRGLKRRAVAFDALMTDWRAALGDMATYDDAAGAAVDAFLDQGLKHHALDDAALYDDPDVSAPIKALYRLLRADGSLDDKADAFDALREAWEAQWWAEVAPEGVSRHVYQLPYWLREEARALMDAGQSARALAVSERAVTVAPDDHASLRAHSQILIQLERFADAVPHLERVIALCPDDPQPVVMLAQCLYQMDDVAGAAAAAASIAEPSADVLVFIGNLELKQENVDGARTAFRRALAVDLDHGPARRLLDRLSGA